MRLQPGQTIAFHLSQCLGDSLLAMIVVNNLVRNGYRVEVFGDYLHSLKDWFPSFDVHPSVEPAQARERLGHFDVLLHVYPRNVVDGCRDWHPRCLVMETWPSFRQIRNMVDIHIDLCEKELGLIDVVRSNGLTVPAGLMHRAFRWRVAIHPTASTEQKMWLPRRFLSLARLLRTKGFEPEVVVAPHERDDWLHLQREHGIAVPPFVSLDAVAAWLYESGWFIGNDSGLAHLASNLGVPAVSLMVRNRIARRWRPGWAPSVAVLPLPVLPGRFAKDRLWRYFLPVSRVLRAFDRLRQRYAPLSLASWPLPLSSLPSHDGSGTVTTLRKPAHSSPPA
jgi:heptosyltransferase-3